MQETKTTGKVKFVLFREDIPLEMPRSMGRDFISIASGPDLRAKDNLMWDIKLVDGRTFVISCLDTHTGEVKTVRVPESNARYYKVEGDDSGPRKQT